VSVKPLAVSLLLACTAVCNVASADAETDYLLHCRGCHLPDGSSVPPEVPSLRDEIGRIVAIAAGRDYVIRVPGVAQSSLADQQLADVLNWVLTEFNANTLPQDFKPFTAKEVGDARNNVLPDPVRHRAEIWQAYSPSDP
jgi:mono/diheme cytochrome c family protein